MHELELHISLHLQDAANAVELKRIIEGLPLETSAVAAVEWRLGQLEPSQFAALLTELARDNHAFRCNGWHFLPHMCLLMLLLAQPSQCPLKSDERRLNGQKGPARGVMPELR